MNQNLPPTVPKRRERPTPFPRRVFLKLSWVAGAVGLSGLVSSAPAAAKKTVRKGPEPDTHRLTTYQVGPHLWVRWQNRVLTSYRAHRSQKYPYLFPVTGPGSGLSLTTETALPWPHHRSMLFGCDRVNGGNYWQGDLPEGQILSDGPTLGETTDTTAVILDQCQWQKPGQPVVCKDRRRITVTVVDDRLRFMDWEVEWTAVQDVAIPKTNHSLFALRADADLTPLGGGALINSQGQSGEKETYGQAAAWCDFSGKRKGIPGEVVEGIALFDHPQNPWAPCPWFTRDYGFMSPTPLYFLPNEFKLPAGQSLKLRYRVVLHAGDAKDAALSNLFKSWAAT